MRLTLGFSPCPNDTFIFDALVHNRIDTEGLEFDFFMADVEELNRLATKNEADITKLSCAAYPYVAGNYLILDSGSALGYKNGPLVVSHEPMTLDQLPGLKIAIPGKKTTANLLFSLACGEATDKVEYLFSDIEGAVLREEAEAGLLIHETRFTYFRRGLKLVADLGEFWVDFTGLPLPLGIIGVSRRLPLEVALKVNRLINKSIEFAFDDSAASYFFIKENAKEMDQKAISNHIKLYVNDYSLNLGSTGKEAIRKMYSVGLEQEMLPAVPDHIFLT